MKKLQIIKEFQNLIPPLTKEEYKLLEQNILKEGIRESIMVYGDTIVDGHNRYEIAQKHNLEFDTTDGKFDSMGEAITWIIKNQLGRRNIFDFTRYELVVMVIEPELLIIGKEKQTRKPIDSVLAPGAKTKHDTRNIIAKKLGWGERKVGMAKFIKENANLETLQRLRNGKLTINKVYENIKEAQKASVLDAKTPFIQVTDSVEEPIKYKKRLTKYLLELDNVITGHMKKNKIADRDKIINEWLSIAANYEYYIKETEESI